MNERVVMDIHDSKDRLWSLAIVGGPLVGSVVLPADVAAGARVGVGQKVASFQLGSTCCLLAPMAVSIHCGARVRAGDPLRNGPERT
jgi:phosphatidylserine decarboxylase